MPFGFTEREKEKIIDNAVEDEQLQRKYLTVNANMAIDGKLTPLYIISDNGRKYPIKVLDYVNSKALKHRYNNGFRFKCRGGNKDFYLHFNGTRFYIEK